MWIINHYTRFYYITVLKLADIELPMTIKNIPKFEHLNAMSTCTALKMDRFFLWLTSDEKHVNVLYLQDGVDHFADQEVVASRELAT